MSAGGWRYVAKLRAWWRRRARLVQPTPEAPRCHNCAFYIAQSCHRHAPNRTSSETTRAIWPWTEWGDWCGDWRGRQA